MHQLQNLFSFKWQEIIIYELESMWEVVVAYFIEPISVFTWNSGENCEFFVQ
jgi:hypothetical protein